MKNFFSLLISLILILGLSVQNSRLSAQTVSEREILASGDFIEMMQNHDLRFRDVQNAFYKY
ncbi:MAG: hypothetical protein M9948_15350, partial [Lentimicrobium sp.]|nr:hypothetical protein [Lentimicrobium sp.]